MSVTNFEVAGTEFSMEMEDGEFKSNPAAILTLPIPLVSGLSSASYQFPNKKQDILDALSPFQIVSKVWASLCASELTYRDENIESIVFVGSWFGQLSALMARNCNNYNHHRIVMVDKDTEACRVAQHLIKCDSYHRRSDPLIWSNDIFKCHFAPDTLFVWTGLEHFDPNEVEKFLERNSESTFLFQSTSMPAADHVNLAHDVEDLMNSVPACWDDGILYRGELSCNLGSRYTMAIRGPGVQVAEPEEIDVDNDELLI